MALAQARVAAQTPKSRKSTRRQRSKARADDPAARRPDQNGTLDADGRFLSTDQGLYPCRPGKAEK